MIRKRSRDFTIGEADRATIGMILILALLANSVGPGKIVGISMAYFRLLIYKHHNQREGKESLNRSRNKLIRIRLHNLLNRDAIDKNNTKIQSRPFLPLSSIICHLS